MFADKSPDPLLPDNHISTISGATWNIILLLTPELAYRATIWLSFPRDISNGRRLCDNDFIRTRTKFEHVRHRLFRLINRNAGTNNERRLTGSRPLQCVSHIHLILNIVIEMVAIPGTVIISGSVVSTFQRFPGGAAPICIILSCRVCWPWESLGIGAPCLLLSTYASIVERMGIMLKIHGNRLTPWLIQSTASRGELSIISECDAPPLKVPCQLLGNKSYFFLPRAVRPFFAGAFSAVAGAGSTMLSPSSETSPCPSL